MDFKDLENKIKKIEQKYSINKKDVSNYYDELYDAFYEYEKLTGDESFCNVYSDIVSGEDCEGVITFPDFSSLYYFSKVREAEEVDYKLLTSITNNAIKEFKEKHKEKELDMC